MNKTTQKILRPFVLLKRELIWMKHNRFFYKASRKPLSLQPVDKNHVRICFVIQRTEIFTSVQTIFEQCCSNDQFDVSVMVLPRYDHGARKIDIESIEKNLEFCRSLKGEFTLLNPYNEQTGEFADLTPNQFDFIFLAMPYQKQYPDKYSFAYLSNIGRLCCIPYGCYFADGKTMIRFGFPHELLMHVDYMFADVDNVYQFVNGKLCLSRNRDNKPIAYRVGYPRFDLVKRNETATSCKTFLWLPRWTISSTDNEKSSFLDYKDLFLSYFREHSELSLIIRPHPAMFENYISNGIMSQKEVEDYKNTIAEMENVVLDSNPSYSTSFDQADCVVADYTSLVIEFLLTNKPVIYLGETENMEEDIKSSFYCCDSFDSITSSMIQLNSGKDKTVANRAKVLIDPKYKPGASARIIDVLLK